MAIWITDSALFLLGTCLLQITGEISCIPDDIIIKATIQVNIQLRLFWTCLAHPTTVAPLQVVARGKRLRPDQL
jgi:hypothetical protein